MVNNNTFSTKIDVKLADKLKQDLTEQGFTFTTPLYTIFRAEKKGITCILYESGALVVQGKEKDPFIEYYLEPEILKEFKYTCPEAYVEKESHIGVDEAGKGDFFGPLCVAACYADEEGIKKLIKIGVKDSKTLSAPTIKRLAKEIQKDFHHEIIHIFPTKYNELYAKFHNLNSLLAWGHATAISELSLKTNCLYAIVDQFAYSYVVENALKKKNPNIRLVQRHHGEEDPVVAAASILAREAFVEGLETLSTKIGVPLPKGASKEVIETGKKLVEKFGANILESVAKTHFKTKDEIFKCS